MYEVCEDAVNDGVKYLEVRFSPILHVNGKASIIKFAILSINSSRWFESERSNGGDYSGLGKYL